MTDILQELMDWRKSIARLDNGEIDDGIMTYIRLERMDKIDRVIAAVKLRRLADEEKKA